ncbi:MAG TPA: NADH:flavin oxidoreductase/NADH oxidase [Phycisphaerae bacterium]|nr:NADH:flavin oxidoreductase/NADH oxidase [Phycisphaerae bacterium]
MPSLFDPLTLRSVTLRNRFGVSPMCMYSSVDGHATDFHLVHLGSRAIGGYALVMAEATAVTPDGRISPDDAGLWKDSQIEPLARITRFLKQHRAAPAIQLAHAGRKAATARPWGHPHPNKPLSEAEGGGAGWKIVGPSPIAFDEGYQVPHELTLPEIHQIQQAFTAAAQRALAAGFDILELHAAHGYLLHEFLSPLANHRTDSYGGSFDNRIRFLLETVRQVRTVLPDSKPLFVRLSCTDWADDRGGWNLEDSIALAKRLKSEGVDLIDCSSGALIPRVAIPAAPGYQVPFAHAISKDANIPTAAVGMLTDPHQCAAIIADGQADMVFTARESLRDPYFPVHAARALNARDKLHLPDQYLRA